MKKDQKAGSKVGIARAYIRVSHQGERGKGDGDREFLSPEMQLNSARKYAEVHLPGSKFDGVASKKHMDIDRSASRLKWQKREGLVALLQAAKRKEFDALIVFKLSRFARNAKEGLELFDEFEKVGCSIHCVKESIDTSTPIGKMMRTLLLAIAEMEADNISEWVGAAFLERVQKGMVHGKSAFWLTKKAKGVYEPNERVADIRRLVDLRLEGRGRADIAEILNAEGIRTATGALWTSDRVRWYISPEKIMNLRGHFVFGTDRDDDDPRRVIVEDAFPAVITQDEADALLDHNKRLSELYHGGNSRRAETTTYILSGLLRCSQCGGPMHSHNTGHKGRPLTPTYLCDRSKTNNVPHPGGVSVTAAGLEDAVLRVVQIAMVDYQQTLEQEPPAKKNTHVQDTSIDKKIERLNESIARLFDLYDSGKLRLEDYDRRYKDLDDQRQRLRQSLRETDSDAVVRLAIEQAAKDGENGDLTHERARGLILAFVERVDALATIEPSRIGLPDGKRGRAAWVTLRMPLRDGTRSVLAPLYEARYSGERVLLDRK